MDSNKREHLKRAVVPSLKKKQWLNAAKSLLFPQTSPAHLLLISVIVNYLGYSYDWMEFALTAFRINRTGAIGSSLIHKITSFYCQQLDSFLPFLY